MEWKQEPRKHPPIHMSRLVLLEERKKLNPHKESPELPPTSVPKTQGTPEHIQTLPKMVISTKPTQREPYYARPPFTRTLIPDQSELAPKSTET